MSEELLLKEYIIKFFPEIDVASLTNEEKEKKILFILAFID